MVKPSQSIQSSIAPTDENQNAPAKKKSTRRNRSGAKPKRAGGKRRGGHAKRTGHKKRGGKKTKRTGRKRTCQQKQVSSQAYDTAATSDE